jgi:hypothetical protein
MSRRGVSTRSVCGTCKRHWRKRKRSESGSGPARVWEEIDVLTDELQHGIGLGHRVRAAGSPVERARVSVTRAIKAALAAIAAADAALGHYLAATIKTGTFCSYGPDPRDAPVWKL